MTKAWRADHEQVKVVEVECPKGMQYPEKDSDGETIYDNTHFDNPQDAARCLLGNAEAAVRSTGYAAEQARMRAQELESRCADVAISYGLAREEWEKWLL